MLWYHLTVNGKKTFSKKKDELFYNNKYNGKEREYNLHRF